VATIFLENLCTSMLYHGVIPGYPVKMNGTKNLYSKVVCLKLGIQVFWDVSGWVSECWCFGRKWCLHLQWSHRSTVSPLTN